MSRLLIYSLLVGAVLVVMSRDASAQTPWVQQNQATTMDLGGPRVGMTVLSDASRELLRDRFGKNIGPVISQFGWQKEKRFMSSPSGFTGVTEFVGLLGGADQGLLLPSLNWLVGARTSEGLEFAVGPNLAPGGVGLAAAAGVTFRAGALNVPLNFAAVRSDGGVRMSILAGFNMRRP
jgi:hypothetical protein